MNKWKFAVDRGGTFTDLIGLSPEGRLHTQKLLSSSPDYEDASIEGIKRVLGLSSDEPFPEDRVEAIRFGTTVATNALLERKGGKVALLITRGFSDLLEIGNQARPEIFSLCIQKPSLLYSEVREVGERIDEKGDIIKGLDERQLQSALDRLKEKKIDAVAVVFLHAYKNPVHELLCEKVLRKNGFANIFLSHKTVNLIKVVSRAQSTVVDAYLSPVLGMYVEKIKKETGSIPVEFMQSAGGLSRPDTFKGKDALLSGPAGGVVAAASVSEELGIKGVIGFDMGGTSTDVSRYDGNFERIYEKVIGGVEIQAEMLNINTVASGGGSILWFDGQKMRTGPESAGASPGPACYGFGGPLAVTDANLLTGRIVTEYFPKTFGPDRSSPLNREVVKEAFDKLTEEINGATAEKMTPHEAALGFLRIANERMAMAIKEISVARGFDVRDYALVCFGGAGGQHACDIASSLQIETIVFHPLSSVMSAYGIGLSKPSQKMGRTILKPYNQKLHKDLSALFAEMEEGLFTENSSRQIPPHPPFPKGGEKYVDSAIPPLRKGGEECVDSATSPLSKGRGKYVESVSPPLAKGGRGGLKNTDRSSITFNRWLDLRPAGTNTYLTEEYQGYEETLRSFQKRYRKTFGFDPGGAPLEVVNLRVEVMEQKEFFPPYRIDEYHRSTDLEPVFFQEIYTREGIVKAPVYLREALSTGARIDGPCIVVDPHTTLIVEAGFTAEAAGNGSIIATKTVHDRVTRSRTSAEPDPILLEVFNNLFMSIATEMGYTLQNTAHSVNIKERLDFSCALFDGNGDLVANAPHIPVHLGSMSDTVKAILEDNQNEMKTGDLYLTNNPFRGGSHLPDMTMVCPVFSDQGKLRFFTAARGHHADIGGITPGSMPPESEDISEEGILVDNLLLVRDGHFREKEIIRRFSSHPYPVRNIDERIADLKAKIASCHKGAGELESLIRRFGWKTVREYMKHIQANAEFSVKQALYRFLIKSDPFEASFEDYLDDGTPIKVKIKISGGENPPETVRAVIDFTGTGPQHRKDNLNTPLSVTRSAILYVVRTLTGMDIPLNSGCLRPIEIIAPERTILNPAPPCPVASGNVETSQRIVDTLLGALGVAGASQGTMNNLLFEVQGETPYYETIAGGSGAMEGCPGASGVQVHMTNTRITDPEILEHRHPGVRLERFTLRSGSGGKGLYPGGDGVIREMTFLKPATLSIISERRIYSPYGMAGGESGNPGENLVKRASGETEKLPHRTTVDLKKGDSIIIQTPGGGGYGSKGRAQSSKGTEGTRSVDSIQ